MLRRKSSKTERTTTKKKEFYLPFNATDNL